MGKRIPSEFIDTLLARIDIVDVIEPRLALRQAGREYKACCPFHQEKTPSFTVSQEKQFYHCFGCGAHGSAIRFLMEYSHLEFVEAVEELADIAGLEVPREKGVPDAIIATQEKLRQVIDLAKQYYRGNIKKQADNTAIEYLQERGISGEVARDFELGFAPDSWNDVLHHLKASGFNEAQIIDSGLAIRNEKNQVYNRFRKRIMFPILDHRGRLAGFGGRILGDDEPKYLNSPETAVFHKGKELYGLYNARQWIREQQKALVVEGYMDVLALVQHGLKNVVATLGTATTGFHLERLFRHCNEIVFCFDGDRAGRDAAWRALEVALPTLLDGRQLSFLFLPDGEDPDSLIRKEGQETFRQRIDAAAPLPEYLLNHLTAQTDIERLDGQARLVDLARPLLDKIPDGVLKERILTRLSEQSQTKMEILAKHGLRNKMRTNRQPARHRGQRQPPPSLVKKAIALLLQNPGLGAEPSHIVQLRKLEIAGVDLLVDMALQVEANPRLNTASLLERYRESDHYPHLEKLVIWPHSVPHELVENEFWAIVAKLQQKLKQQRVESLLIKSRDEPLSAEEKQELLTILPGQPQG